MQHPGQEPIKGWGLTAEDSVLDSWAAQAAQAQLVADGVIGDDAPCVIATGTGWPEAVASVDWQRDELLALDRRRQGRWPGCSWARGRGS